ncbi:MAG: hypothetical protein ACREFR_05870 [Limisphaerales bacterium]
MAKAGASGCKPRRFRSAKSRAASFRKIAAAPTAYPGIRDLQFAMFN